MQESNVICALDVYLFIVCHDGMKVTDDFGRKKKEERERERERERKIEGGRDRKKKREKKKERERMGDKHANTRGERKEES